MWSKLLLKLGLRNTLTLDDFNFSPKEMMTLQSLDVFQRAMLFRVCEVVRLCNEGEKRKVAIEIRDLLMGKTKSQSNLLIHELPVKEQKLKDDLPKHPLLPRFDSF